MLKNVLLIVAVLTALTVLAVSGTVSGKSVAEAAWSQRIVAVSPQMMRLAARTAACLGRGDAGCLVADVAHAGAAVVPFSSPTWKSLGAYSGAVRGCASQFEANAVREWFKLKAPLCPPDAFTVYFALKLDASQADSLNSPFTAPRGWWLSTEGPAAAAIFDDRFAGVVTLTLPSTGNTRLYVWARSFQP